MEQVKVGGETSAYCTSCRAMRHHVVVAMTGAVPAKVECLSCHKQHKYKGYPPGEKPGGKAGPKKEKAPGTSAPRRTSKSGSAEPAMPSVNPLDALLASRAGVPTRGYSPAERYAVGELLSHPSFGVGAVTSTPSPGKMAVLFRDSTRLLLHERQPVGASGAPKLQPPPRREDGPRTGVSDAPPKTKPLL